MTMLWIVLGLIVLVLAVTIGIYNGLIRARNEVGNAWSQIDVQLKRRHDLIPNLVETCKGYVKHERETLEKVVELRNAAKETTDRSKQIALEGQLSHTLAGLNVVLENYPELKANQNFLAVQEELASTENKISFSRQYFNDAVLTYNNKIQVFPSNLLAGFFNFSPETYFKVEDPSEREVVRVSF